MGPAHTLVLLSDEYRQPTGNQRCPQAMRPSSVEQMAMLQKSSSTPNFTRTCASFRACGTRKSPICPILKYLGSAHVHLSSIKVKFGTWQ